MDRPLTEIVAEMRARAAEATPGGWLANGSYVEREDGEWDIARCQCGHLSIRATHDEAAANAAHIAASCPSNVIALADGFDERGREIERLTRERDALRELKSGRASQRRQIMRLRYGDHEKAVRHLSQKASHAGLRAREAQARATAAEARVKELEDALRPFGNPIMPHWSEPDHWPFLGKDAGLGWPTCGDVRRAALLLPDRPPLNDKRGRADG